MEKLGYSKTLISLKRLKKHTAMANNGFLSAPFPLFKGVRQGCPLSLFSYKRRSNKSKRLSE